MPTRPAPPPPSRIKRKTRIVCISDTHNASPLNGTFKVPKGDVLIHAGDLTKQGTFRELKKTVDWISGLEHEVKIVIAGNHDITLDKRFYSAYSSRFHNQYPQDQDACISLFTKDQPNSTTPSHKSTKLVYLNHTSQHIILSSPTGPRTHFKIFGSPYTPQRGPDPWAFQYPPYPSSTSASTSFSSSASTSSSTSFPPHISATILWSEVPTDTDILLTHGPPKYHLDSSRIQTLGSGFVEDNKGCEALRRAVWKVRPLLHVFGHVHGGRGCERVRWVDFEGGGEEGRRHVRYMEEMPIPHSSTIPFSPTENTLAGSLLSSGKRKEGNEGQSSSSVNEDISTGEGVCNEKLEQEILQETTWKDPSANDGRVSGKMSLCDVSERTKMWGSSVGGLRRGEETLMVNAAVMKGDWPYKGVNKPIVVDLDLEVWEGEGEGEGGVDSEDVG